jgi:hypothetical protein
VRRLALVLAAVALAGCGGGSKHGASTTSVPDPAAAMNDLIAKDPSLAGTVQTLFAGPTWALVQSTSKGTAHAVAFHVVNGTWVPDRTGIVKVRILGPQPGATTTTTPSVAVALSSKLPFVETGLWVDGVQLTGQGGGSSSRGTVFGTPKRPLKPGEHVAVAYARSKAHGTAVAWVFGVG